MIDNSTKSQLAKALKELMKTEPLNRITIQQIVDACGVQRQTFYYHFKDIYDALEWMYHEETLALIAEYETLDTWQEAALKVLYYVKENSEVCLNAFNSFGHKQLRKFFYEDFLHIYQRTLNQVLENQHFEQDFLNFIANLFVYGSQGYVFYWLDSGMKETPEQIISWLRQLFEGNIDTLLRKHAGIQPKGARPS